MMTASLTQASSAVRGSGLRRLATALHLLLLELRPILSTLRRHRIAAGLIVLEVALTCAIVANALHLMLTRLDFLRADSGLAESELIVLEVRYGKAKSMADLVAPAAQEMLRLRALPGVKAVTSTNQVAYGGNSSNGPVALEPGEKAVHIGASQYFGDEQWLPTLGIKLIEGRNFTADEVQDFDKDFSGVPRAGQVIINKALADRLFPGRSALGQTVYGFGASPSTVIGVVETLTHPALHRAGYGGGYAMLAPLRGLPGTYVVRADAARLDTQIKAAAAAIEAADTGGEVTSARTLLEMRADFYAQDRAMAWLMAGVCVALLLVTAMGIVGLASFWVQQRTRMIGTRRALGATEGQIQRYFQLENLLLTSAGIVIGLMGAVALSQWLMQGYGLPRLPWAYLPTGAAALWLLGQLAVWVPARRAAQLAPVAALRS